jgi:hypothetical protein
MGTILKLNEYELKSKVQGVAGYGSNASHASGGGLVVDSSATE